MRGNTHPDDNFEKVKQYVSERLVPVGCWSFRAFVGVRALIFLKYHVRRISDTLTNQISFAHDRNHRLHPTRKKLKS